MIFLQALSPTSHNDYESLYSVFNLAASFNVITCTHEHFRFCCQWTKIRTKKLNEFAAARCY